MSALDNLADAIHLALDEHHVEQVLAALMGSLVGLAVEVVRRSGNDYTKAITLDGGELRDVTIGPSKESP